MYILLSEIHIVTDCDHSFGILHCHGH